MAKKALQTSETRIIKRSAIRKNPSNIKRHSDERIKLQQKNLKNVGYLGGIVWNETTGNLVDGHRRIAAMDIYYGYDGTADYDVKVEVCHMTEAEEKQQMVYMSAGDTKADIDLIADIAEDLNLEDIGFSEEEIDDILNIANGNETNVKDIMEDIIPSRNNPPKDSESYEALKAQVKEGKERTKEIAERDAMNATAFITLSFSTYDGLVAFCDYLGISSDSKFAKGEDVLKLL